ncbi:MAG: creatininase family protein [Anaerolineae bacterium]|nr:creatininase family protein [Anaerolineae bacterium]
MHWEELTGDEFPKQVAAAQGVCLLPLSCIERHAHHLPLGTDMYIGRELCRRAAALEPAIIFPDFIFTQILEARHCAGTIAIEVDLMLQLLENVCNEIARNGLKKIVLVNAHGGNNHLIRFFLQAQLAQPRDYVVYVASPPLSEEDRAAVQAQWESTYDGHAGESETSAILAIRPDLVRHEHLKADDEGMALNRLKALREMGIETGIWWYADHPTHYSGDGSPATGEKGDRMLDARARALAQAIRVIKEDNVSSHLQNEFYTASAQPRAAE